MPTHHWTLLSEVGDDFGMTSFPRHVRHGSAAPHRAGRRPVRIGAGTARRSRRSSTRWPARLVPAIEVYWLRSTAIGGAGDVAGFDGVWVIPGSPYENTDGVLAAIRAARTGADPVARHLRRVPAHRPRVRPRRPRFYEDAENAELNPDAAEALIVPLECSLLGEEARVRDHAGRSPPTPWDRARRPSGISAVTA